VLSHRAHARPRPGDRSARRRDVSGCDGGETVARTAAVHRAAERRRLRDRHGLVTGAPALPAARRARAPGGESVVACAAADLSFEQGPTTDIRLQWGTYYDASDQAGQSRIWGGIHITADDFTGRMIGHTIGVGAYQQAVRYLSGTP
jgi:hypothetical protein